MTRSTGFPASSASLGSFDAADPDASADALDLRRRAPFDGRSAEVRRLDADRPASDAPIRPRPPATPSEARQAAREARRDAREARRAARRLNQANRGLRMLLVAGLLAIVVSWVGAIGRDYMKLQMIDSLIAGDQDALRVMCAAEPPGPTEFGWQRICEAAAAVGPSEGFASDLQDAVAE